MDKPPKKLSCQRCRLKKIKCNYEYPCNNCDKGKYECIQVTNDMRKKRPTVNYVESLEKKYSSIMNVLRTANNMTSINERASYLASVNLGNLIDGLDTNYNDVDGNDDNDVSVYGPISIYDNNDMVRRKNQIQTDEFKYIKQLNTDNDVLHCIKLFFVWQYPDMNMFIFREAFLQEFFKPKYYNLYCSRILVLSICALGSRMSEDENIYNKSIKFYNEAKSLLLSKFNNPSITSLQSFLLLSFYDIFNGSNSSGWMLSGNAIRMGFDLGFQLHPNSWFLKLKVSNYSKEIDNEIKSRIYWGTYLADHFISLLLGRPSLLKLNDATIPETDDLPELHWIDEYRYLDEKDQANPKKISNISSPLKSVINLINISDNMLNDIFNKNFNQDFMNDNNHLILTVTKLNEYNEKIMNWKRNLPTDLQFNKELLRHNADNPTLSCIRYYYYILVLCLNRPFIGLDDDIFKNLNLPPELVPRAICLECIEELFVAINRFKTVHGLRKASIFIVYCSILSISIILLLKNSNLIKNESQKLIFFLTVLKQSSKTWKLAEKSLNSITSRLTEFNIDINTLDDIEIDFRRETSETPEIDLENSNSIVSNDNLNQTNSLSTLMNPSHSGEITEPIHQPGLGLGDVGSNGVVVGENNLEFFGGPPVLMTSDLFNQDWESLFPDYIFNEKNNEN